MRVVAQVSLPLPVRALTDITKALQAEFPDLDILRDDNIATFVSPGASLAFDRARAEIERRSQAMVEGQRASGGYGRSFAADG